MPNITDPEIWDKLSLASKLKWLCWEADMSEARCTTCYHYVCVCGEDF